MNDIEFIETLKQKRNACDYSQSRLAQELQISRQNLNEIENGKRIISDWPERVTCDYGGAKGWEKEVRKLMNIGTLNAAMENQLQKFKLDKLTDYRLVP